jgi:hypothetical protein
MAEPTHHPLIRPSPEYLKTLRTIRVLTPETDDASTKRHCRKRGYDFRLELKLFTVRARYWFIAHCVGEPFAGWQEGKVYLEWLDGGYKDPLAAVPYGSDDVKWLQRFDYLAMLRADLDRLLDEPWSWELDDRIREVRKEIYRVIGVPKFKFKELEDGTIVVADPKYPGDGKSEPGSR